MKGIMISFLFGITLVTVSAQRLELGLEWQKYKGLYGKEYDDGEETRRRSIWEETYEMVQKHNKEADEGKHTYRIGMNKFADMSTKELPRGFIKPNTTHFMLGSVFQPIADMELPTSVNWIEQNVVTPVKDQGLCGSCWSFSTTGALEGQHALSTGNLVSLSEQNLLDCDQNQGGCNGGSPLYAYEYIAQNGGIDTEDSYPYVGQVQECQFNAGNVGATLSSWSSVESGDEQALQQAVATVGPISVAIDSSNPHFKVYQSGVYSNGDCSPTAVDHAVLVVGYGTTSDGVDYWLVKNSWGANWGNEGYAMMARNQNNLCGIASYASYPIV